MSDQQVRKRRITLLVVIAIILTGAAGGWYAYQSSRQSGRVQRQLAEGLTAYEQGDYEAAYTRLQPLMGAPRLDARTHKAFGHAAMATTQADPQRVVPGIRSLREAFNLDPADIELGHETLSYMLEFGLDAEALAIADRLLRHHPDDLVAHRAKAQTLARTGRHSEAIAAAKAGLAVNPLDTNLLLLSTQLRQRVGESPTVILNDLQQLQRQHPQDPRVNLALAMAYELAKDARTSREQLDTALKAPLPPDDETYLNSLVLFMDAVGWHDRALATLQAHATPQQPAMYAELIQRLAENGRDAQAVQAIDALPPDQRTTQLLVLEAIALHNLGQADRAKAVLDAIAQKYEASDVGPAIAAGLAAAFDPQAGVQPRIDALKAATDKAPGISSLHALLAQAYTRAREFDLARQHWLQAARQRPNWVQPLVQLAEEAVHRGDITPALSLADRARQLSPDDPAVQTVWLLAASRSPNVEPDALRLMLDQAQRLLAEKPDDAWLLATKTELLARLNQKQDAVATAELALKPGPVADRAALLRLAETDRRHHLGLGPAIEQAIAEHHGQSPELATLRALRLIDEGKPEQALALLDDAVSKADADDKSPWLLARARVLDRIDPDQAEQNWLALADELPDSAEAQQRALMTQEIQSNRKLMGRTIDRLGKALGETDTRYRLYRAAYLLSDPQPETLTANAEQAGQLLKSLLDQDPNNTQALLLDAISLERLGRKDTALQRVKTAAEQEPGSAAIGLKQAQLCAQLGLNRQAIDAARLVARNDQATTPQRVAAASILVGLGEPQTAGDVLAQLDRQNRLSAEAALLLAQLHMVGGDLDSAIRVLAKLDPRTPESVTLMAALEHKKGQPEQAEATLAQLDQFNLDETRRSALLADYYNSIGSGDSAARHLMAAAKDHPQDLQAWRHLIAFLIDAGRAEQAIAALASALQHHPADPGLKALGDHTDPLTQSATRSVYRPLLLSVLLKDEDRPVAIQALNLLKEAENSSWTVSELTERLRKLAGDQPGVLAVQNLAAEVCLNAGRPDLAADIAAAAMTRFPTDVRSAMIAARASVAAQRWQAAIQAVDAWKRRSAASAASEADLLVAQARLGMGDPRSAVALLQPHISDAFAQPDANHLTILTYARALIAESSVAKARLALTPLLGSSDWRLAYIQLGAEIKRADDAADWYNAVNSAIPADASNEQMALAQALFAAGQRTGNTGLASLARQRADELAARPDAPGMSFYFRGTLHEQANDLASAEADYRRALFLDPGLTPAKNNLAMTLAKQGKDLEEAVKLAQAVVDATPESANALDTLAYVQLAAGQIDQAIATIDRAIQLEPRETKWQQRRAQIVAKRQEQAANAAGE